MKSSSEQPRQHDRMPSGGRQPLLVEKAVPLCQMCPGQVARFHEASLDGATARFLRALGLTRTSEFRICQSGEPCIVQVRSTRIGLSRAVADQIYVIPVPQQGT